MNCVRGFPQQLTDLLCPVTSRASGTSVYAATCAVRQIGGLPNFASYDMKVGLNWMKGLVCNGRVALVVASLEDLFTSFDGKATEMDAEAQTLEDVNKNKYTGLSRIQ
jgi:hypothetical protein